MEMFSIASGSSGNSICVGNETTHLLIDAGISGKRIEEGLNTYDYTTPDMDGVLVTHEHGDHICGLGVIARKYGLPIYGTEGTIAAIKNTSSVGKIDESLSRRWCSTGCGRLVRRSSRGCPHPGRGRRTGIRTPPP